MEETKVAAPRTETEPHTELGKKFVEFAQRLDRWCEAETDVTHRQARVAVGLAVIGGAAVIAGWDNASWYDILSDKYFRAIDEGGKELPFRYEEETNLVSVVKKLVGGPVRVTEDFPTLHLTTDFTVNFSPEQRNEALDALLKVEGRQAAKIFTAKMAFLAGIGVAVAGQLLGSNEKIKGSTGVGQWAAQVMKSIGEVL